MQNIGTWLAIAGVAVGFVILIYLLFKEPVDKKKKE
jgi:hypothetical protein